MSQSRFGWALGVVAPWCLGMGLLVSFTAAAGHDASTGASVARLASRAPGGTDALVPSMPSATLAERLRRPLLASLNTAALSVGDPRDLPSRPDEVDPRRDLKKGAGAFPTPDRTRRGDPAISLRPTFDAKLRSKGGAAAQFDGLLFNGLDYLAFDGFNGAGGDGTGSTSPAGPARALISPAPRRAIEDGSTPAIPRAVSLSSSTPVQPDHAPIEVLAAAHVPVLGRADTTVVPASPKPDYAALIDPANTKAELRCLAEAVYFEARSEPEEGQAAVAQVVLNRVKSGLYPPSVCGVVYQNRHRHLACQFTFACEGKALRITDAESWRTATRVADEVMSGKTYLSPVGTSTHYHAHYVKPRWARALKKTDTIGAHTFYKLRPGQT
jgi:hypothetical protein